MSRDIDAEELYYKLLEDVKSYLDTDDISDAADEALAEVCKLLVEDPMAEFYGDDPNGRYQMYTAAGNAAVAEMVTTIKGVMKRGGVTRIELPQLLVDAMKAVAKTHPEVYDTEPRGKISDEISEACDKLGWKPVDL